MAKVFIKSETHQRVDPETGELITFDSSKLHVVKVESEDKFVQIYFEMLKTFYEIKYVSDLKLIVELSAQADYNTGRIDLSPRLRESICEKIGLSKSHLSKSLKRLKELSLISGDRGSYLINEAVFWKGDKKTRKELMSKKGLEFIVQFKLDDEK